MGILNVTPDSFSDGYPTLAQAMAQAERLINAGADILDIGGESTRPGSEGVSVEEELARILPVIRALTRGTKIPISVDTQKVQVAQAALDEGVAVINHVSASLDYAGMLPILAKYDAGYVAMHMRARPKTMQRNPAYDDPVAEVTQALAEVGTAAEAAGVAAERIIYDPGIGFGKTLAHNLALMRSLPEMSASLKRPMLLGISRKSWLQHLLGKDAETIDARDAYTALVTTTLNSREVICHRIHNVALVKNSLKLRGALAPD